MLKDKIMNMFFQKTDSIPAVHFGYWNELLDEWAEQGHISKDLAKNWADGNEADEELDKILGWDYNWNTLYYPNLRLWPTFDRVVLEELPEGFIRVQNADGLIVKEKVGVISIPAEDDYQLKDRKAFEELYLPKMQYDDSRIDLDQVRAYAEKDNGKPKGLFVGSVLGDIRNMFSVIGLSYMTCDDYELLDEIITTYADMQYKCVERILSSGIKFDYAHYWEDVCFKNGPLISPTMFEDLCAKHYKKRNDLIKSYGIKIISLDCDGVIGKLLPIWYENGINTIFPIEIGTWGDQFEPARQQYGYNLKGVGAMDKTALRKDKQAVDEEIERITKLAKLGGYIPCPDHRIMPGSHFDLVKYYVEKIKEIKL